MIIEDVANKLADMPGQSLPIYPMQFPDKDASGNPIINCIAIFPTGGGVGGNIGSKPTQMTSSAGGIDYMDYPGCQVQVRYTDPFNAYKVAEDIRQWLDENLPTGYLRCDTNRSLPDDLTSSADLTAAGGPMYRFSVDFSLIKIRT